MWVLFEEEREALRYALERIEQRSAEGAQLRGPSADVTL